MPSGCISAVQVEERTDRLFRAADSCPSLSSNSNVCVDSKCESRLWPGIDPTDDVGLVGLFFFFFRKRQEVLSSLAKAVLNPSQEA